MSVNRPTFHESWYRVAALRPRLRATVRTYRQHFRGRRWHVLQDPTSNTHYRLDDAGYQLVGLLDGRRTVEAAWRICSEQLADRAPTQGETLTLLGELYTSNLLQSDLPADAAGMFESQRQRQRRKVTGFASNLLFMRFPVLDPDVWLDRWSRVLGVVFTPAGTAAWIALIVAAIVIMARRFDELVGGMAGVLAPGNLVLLYLAFAGIKIAHEIGHGVATKRIARRTGANGEIHVMGITLLVLTPVPYVDASSAWTFRSKWHRAIVGAAGMYVELAIAAAAGIVWASTSPGVVNAIAYNVVFVASVSTILFNANPLLRFDGYYILSDLLEIPGLAQRSKDHLLYSIKRRVFGVQRLVSPALTAGESVWLPTYAILAFAYRVLISVGIILFVADRFFFIGTLLAIGAAITWGLAPLARLVRYLVAAPELARVRRRAVLTSLGTLLVVGGGLGAIPVPERARAEGVVEPVDVAIIHAEVDGFVQSALPSRPLVEPDGPPLLVARNHDLEAEHAQLLAERRRTELERNRADVAEVALAQSLDERLDALDVRLAQVERRMTALSVQAPFPGRWIAPDAERRPGAFVRRGDRLGVVASDDRLLIRAVTDQGLGPRIDPAGAVEIRVRGRPGVTLHGRVRAVLPAGREELPSAALGYAAGGLTPIANDDESGTRTVEPFFEAHIDLPPDVAADAHLCSGQRVIVRFDMPSRPLLVQGWRALRQLVQRRFQI